MKSALNIFLMILLGLSVSFCSMFSKDTEETEEEPQQYEQYSSSGVYNDIEGESREVSSSGDDDYSDDDYGTVADNDDEGDDGDDEDGDDGEDEDGDDGALLSGGGDEEPAYQASDYPQPDPPSFKTAATEPGDEPLPVEKLEPVKKKKKRKARKVRRKRASVAKTKFKNGMYRMGRKCNMRKKPSTKAAKVGKVKKGKKLWVEAHNGKWVKIYKKSGAVYLHKSCL